MITLFNIRIRYIFIPAMLMCLSSCVFHARFPFICFQSGCVNQKWSLKPLEKRLKGKLFKLKQKRKKKSVKPATQKRMPDGNEADDGDSATVVTGTRVEYTKYLLLFKLMPDTNRFDTVIVFHTSEFKTLRQSDQNRLDYFLKTLSLKKLIRVYIKEIPAGAIENASVIKRRRGSVAGYLHKSGIPRTRITYEFVSTKKATN